MLTQPCDFVTRKAKTPTPETTPVDGKQESLRDTARGYQNAL